MPIQERKYHSAAETEFDKNIRDLDERNTKAQKFNPQEDDKSVFSDAESANEAVFIDPFKSRKHSERAQAEFELLEKTETRNIVDDFENPRERNSKLRTLDEYKREINIQRAKRDAEQVEDNNNKISKNNELERN